ncbi:MAG: hypothetical protein AAF800_00605 [Planctomycetota bacterium]
MHSNRPQDHSAPATEGMPTARLRTATPHACDGKSLNTGLCVVLRPGMLASSGEDPVGQGYGIVIEVTRNAVTLRWPDGTEQVVPHDQVYAVATSPADPPQDPAASAEAEADPSADAGRGELSIDNQVIADCDRRRGVPVPLGALVLDDDVCEVIGGDDQIAILRDGKSRVHAQRWGVLHVQASGPGFSTQYGPPAESATRTMYPEMFRAVDAAKRQIEIITRLAECMPEGWAGSIHADLRQSLVELEEINGTATEGGAG